MADIHTKEKTEAPSKRDKLLKFVSDMYSVEEQALTQMVSAPDDAGDPRLAGYYRTHHAETGEHARRMRERLEALGGDPSAVKNAVMKIGGKAFLLFARVQPDTPGKLHTHSYSYEAMEWAGYGMLAQLAEQTGDGQTAKTARDIQKEEREMMERLERGFDQAEQASNGDADADKMRERLPHYLSDAHALETQTVKFLEKSMEAAGSPLLSKIYQDQLAAAKSHADEIARRLRELDSNASFFKDKALAAGAFNWSLFFKAQSDTPFKLAAFVYALGHLGIGGLELLRRSAERAADKTTAELCEEILLQQRHIAGRLADAFPDAVSATLRSL